MSSIAHALVVLQKRLFPIILLDKNCKINYVVFEHYFEIIQGINYCMLVNPGQVKGHLLYEETRKIYYSQNERE
jgi:hypothetical protein